MFSRLLLSRLSLTRRLTLFFTLALFGAFYGLMDVAMNTHGATLERLSGRSLMNGFHARYSLGGFIGAGYGGLCAQADVPFLGQAVLSACMYLAVLPWMRRSLLEPAADRHVESQEPQQRDRKRPWVFYLLGLLGLCSTIGEGAAADWGAVLLRDTWRTSPFVASLPYIAFSALMVTGRMTGDRLTDRHNREWVVRTGGFTAGVGLLVGLLTGGPVGITLGWALLVVMRRGHGILAEDA